MSSQKHKIIDLSNDFRLRGRAVLDGKSFCSMAWPELKKGEIKKAKYICQSCVVFATAIQVWDYCHLAKGP